MNNTWSWSSTPVYTISVIDYGDPTLKADGHSTPEQPDHTNEHEAVNERIANETPLYLSIKDLWVHMSGPKKYSISATDTVTPPELGNKIIRNMKSESTTPTIILRATRTGFP